jgi:hypothetical protein
VSTFRGNIRRRLRPAAERQIVSRMRATEPGIARDTCPHCCERAQLRWWNFLPQRGRAYVTCRVCKEESQVAVATGIVSLLAGMGSGAVVMFLLCRHASAGITISAAIVSFLATSTAVNWAALRLEIKDH